MKTRQLIGAFTVAAILFVVLTLAAAVRAQEFLPTPYTAEQIRDGWPEGSRAITKVITPDRTTESRSWVSQWSLEEATFCDVILDAEGEPAGEESCSSLSWDDLRDHAKFSAETSTRERTQNETEFGELDGWLYTTQHPDGSKSAFFFADKYPGPPIVYGQTSGETSFMSAEIVWRGQAED